MLSSLVSIAVASILFTATCLLSLADLISRRARPSIPDFARPVAAFCVWVIVSMAFSSDPLESFINLKKLSLFFYILLIATYFNGRANVSTSRWIERIAGLSALYGILQYFWLMDVNLLHRITGFMSHWMTFSGQLMLVVVSLVCRVAFQRAGASWKARLETLALLFLCGFALVLTLTRNAWLGTAAGILFVVTLAGFARQGAEPRNVLLRIVFGFRWTGAAMLALLVVFLLLPDHYKARFYAGLDPKDTTTSIRLELLRTGVGMVREHPVVGVGPRMVPHSHGLYSGTDFPSSIYIHLHNNFLQVAAESGLPALVLWLAIWATIAWRTAGFALRAPPGDLLFFESVRALAVLAAFMVAGLFEYNFGDSEVLIPLLFYVVSPYVSAQESRTA